MTNKKIAFRPQVSDDHSPLDRLDTQIRITSFNGWVALIAIIILIVTMVAWGFIGRIPRYVTTQGVLLSPGGIFHVPTHTTGQIIDIYFDVGDNVEDGQIIARIQEQNQLLKTTIIAPKAGRIVELQVNEGDVVQHGQSLMSLEALESTELNLTAILYVPSQEGKKIKQGMVVQISPNNINREESGYMLGKVISVGEYAASKQSIFRILGNENLVDSLIADGPLIELIVDLTIETGNGAPHYKWSNSGQQTVNSGTFVTAWIITKEERPIDLVLPIKK